MMDHQSEPDQRMAGAVNEMEELMRIRFARRRFLNGTLHAAAQWVFFANLDLSAKEPPTGSLLGFPSIPISHADAVVVPPGYSWEVVSAWGDPVVVGAPGFIDDASQPAEVQALQAGMGHDGMCFFPLPLGSKSSDHGLLAVNYEYIDDHLLFPDGQENWSAAKVQKAKNAHGIAVLCAQYGPYNFARVEALARLAGPGRILALELSNLTRDYAWQRRRQRPGDDLSGGGHGATALRASLLADPAHSG